MDILFLSPADWTGARGRFQHLAEGLARHHRLLYVDGLGLRSVSARDWRRCGAKLLRRLGEKPRHEAPSDAAGLSLGSPLVIPAQGRLAQACNRRRLRRYLRGQVARRGFVDPLYWLAYPHPDLAAILPQLSPRHLIYDCVDRWSQFTGVYGDLDAWEEQVMRQADMVLATTPSLRTRALRFNPRSFLVPNGYSQRDYADLPTDSEPEDLTAIPSPRIVFVGNIAEWLDLDLVESLARSRPDWHFVFIGPWQVRRPVPDLPNLHWLGFRTHREIPAYLSACGVGIIPFQENELVRHVDPLKVYEYMAAGCPVVSTPLPALGGLTDHVRIARGEAEWLAALESAMAEDGTHFEERRRVVSPHSWERRLDQIAALAREHLDLELLPDRSSPDGMLSDLAS